MNIKRIFPLVIGLLVCALLVFGWFRINVGGPAPYPINIGNFSVISNTTINPDTLLEDIKHGKEVTILQTQPDIPDNPPFITSVEWSQNDYLKIANAFHKAIWNDNPESGQN